MFFAPPLDHMPSKPTDKGQGIQATSAIHLITAVLAFLFGIM